MQKDQIPEPTIDYSQCAKEPITTPGAIQFYGGLVIVRDGEVIAHSKNIDVFLPVDSSDFLHQKVSELCPELSKLLLTVSTLDSPQKISYQALGDWIVGLRKAENDLFYVEFFPPPTHLLDLDGLEEEIDRLCRKFHYPAKDRSQFLNDVCHLFQKYLRFDQVFVQFLNEGDIIEIIAEANNGKIEPVLGLHFSSKEIPSQARELYLKQLIRFKQSSQSTPVDIVSDAKGGFDLTYSFLREPSKFMTVYMQNISASTLISTSIIVEKKLAAILTMHNVQPLLLDPRAFDRLVGVVRRVSLELLRLDDLIKKNANSKLWELLMQDFPLDRLQAVQKLVGSPHLGRLLAHNGAVVTKEQECVGTFGECQNGEVLKTIMEKVSNLNGSSYSSSNLSEDFVLAPFYLGDFAGLMSIKFEDISVLFFRKSFHFEMKWRNSTPDSFEEVTHIPRFSPAGSFQFLLQEIENQSRPWTEKDLAFTGVIAEWISEDFES